jgi:hypothetical protein
VLALVGCRVTLAVPLVTLSTVLVAITERDCVAETVAGAVYKPPVEILPGAAALSDHLTAEFAVPVTTAVKGCD